MRKRTRTTAAPPALTRTAAAPSEPASNRGSHAERMLHACGPALYPHLHQASRCALRLVCKVARQALDASVRGLELNGASFTQDGGKLLEISGTKWPGTERLTLRDCYWVDLSSGMLPPRLKSLCVHDTELCLRGLPQLTSLAATLQELDLGFVETPYAANKRTHSALAAVLTRLTSLKRLRFNNGNHDEDDTKVYDAHNLYPAIGALTGLTELMLCGIVGREKPSDLQILSGSLARLTRLEVLHLGVGLHREGAEALAPALALLTRLRDLKFEACQLGTPEGESWEVEPEEVMAASYGLEALTETLAGLTGLTRLGVVKNCLGEGICLLPAAMPSLRTLDMTDTLLQMKPAYEATAQVLLRYPSLTELVLSDNYITGDGVATIGSGLSTLTNLRTLRMTGCAFEDESSGPRLGPVLRQLTNLETLVLSDSSMGICARGRQMAPFWNALALLTSLTHLDLDNVSFCDKGIADVAKALPKLSQLRHLNIGNNGITDKLAVKLVAGLSALTNLKQLHTASDSWTTKGITCILGTVSQAAPPLEVLVLWPTTECAENLKPAQLHQLVPPLCQLSSICTLRELRLVRKGTAADAVDRSAVLAALPSLERLYF